MRFSRLLRWPVHDIHMATCIHIRLSDIVFPLSILNEVKFWRNLSEKSTSQLGRVLAIILIAWPLHPMSTTLTAAASALDPADVLPSRIIDNCGLLDYRPLSVSRALFRIALDDPPACKAEAPRARGPSRRVVVWCVVHSSMKSSLKLS